VHAQQAEREQWQEGRVEEDEHRPEVDLAEPFVQLDPHHLGQPVVDVTMKANQPPMIVCGSGPSRRNCRARWCPPGRRTGTPGMPPIRKLKYIARQNSIGMVNLTSPERPERHQVDEPGGDGDQLRRQHEQRAHVGLIPL
jgi:hypothetical protein